VVIAPIHANGRTDRQADVAKLIVTSHICFAKSICSGTSEARAWGCWQYARGTGKRSREHSNEPSNFI